MAKSDYIELETRVKLSAIWILAKREILGFYRNKARIISTLAQSILFLIIFSAGFVQLDIIIDGITIDSRAFVASGIIAMAILFSGVFGGLGVIRDKMFGFLQELLVAPVSRRVLMMGKTLGVALQSLMQCFTILGVSVALGFFGYRWDLIWRAFILMGPALLFSIGVVGIGLVVSTRVTDFQSFGLIQTFLIMPMFWFSGALFAFNTVPLFMQVIIMINPISYGVDIFRFILLGVSYFPLWLNLSVLGIFGICLILLGAYSFSKLEIS
ncbi:MAG: Multidrug ABC transporter permease [Promethearchaeota archaeon]|nr:MAG: Multidrug ABC transporter permease [Candidatus Lokiarchaeota archaeon]